MDNPLLFSPVQSSFVLSPDWAQCVDHKAHGPVPGKGLLLLCQAGIGQAHKRGTHTEKFVQGLLLFFLMAVPPRPHVYGRSIRAKGHPELTLLHPFI